MNIQNTFQKVAVLFCAFICISNAFGQEELIEFSHASNTERDITAGFAMAHPVKNEAAVFLIDNLQIHAYGINENFDISSKIELVKEKRNFDEIIAKMVHPKGYTLFFNDTREKIIRHMTFDFDSVAITKKGSFPFSLKKKRVLANFTYNEKAHILVLDTDDSTLHLLKIDTDFNLTEKIFDTSSFELVSYTGRKTSLNRFITANKSKLTSINVDGTNYPISLSEAAAKYKIYREENQLFLTMDHHTNYTQLFTLDLDLDALDFRKIEKPETSKTITQGKTNSFIRDDKLAQLVLGKDELLVEVKDLTGGEMLYAKKIPKKGDDVSNTSAFYQKKSWKEEDKKLDNKQYFRKIANNEISIVLNPSDAGYKLTYGSWNKVEQASGGDIALGVFGGAVGGIIGALVLSSIGEAISPGFQSYAKYASGRTIYTNDHFATDFEVQSDSTSPDLFEQFDNYVDTKEDNVPFLLFTYHGKNVLGLCLWDAKYEIMTLTRF